MFLLASANAPASTALASCCRYVVNCDILILGILGIIDIISFVNSSMLFSSVAARTIALPI